MKVLSSPPVYAPVNAYLSYNTTFLDTSNSKGVIGNIHLSSSLAPDETAIPISLNISDATAIHFWFASASAS